MIFILQPGKDNAVYISLDKSDIGEDIDNGVLKDERIELTKKDGSAFNLRRIDCWNDPHRKVYEFISNNFELSTNNIADIYKKRWQIETMLNN